MPNSPAIDIKDKLVAESVGTYSTDIFINKEPGDINNCVTIYDTLGLPIEGADCNGEIDKFRFQIRVRNSSHINCYNKLKEIEGFLNFLSNYDTGTILYSIIYRVDTGYLLQVDEKNRVIFVQNYEGLRQF